MRKKVLALSAVALTALAGCGSSSAHKSAATLPTTTTLVGTGSGPGASTTVAATTTVPATTSVPPTTATASTAPTTAAPATTVPSGPPACQTANLTAALGAPNGAAGTIYYSLTFTNKGSATCTLFGYPGVSFVTGPTGTQVGAAAARSGGTPTAVTVAPSASAHAQLGISEASNYGPGCEMTPVTGLRVYPPGQTAALFVPHTGTGCANKADILLHVGAVVAG